MPKGVLLFLRLLGATLLCALSAFPASASPRAVESIPNPRPRGEWMVDEPVLLDAPARAELEQKLDRLERTTTVEFAVVILATIGDGVPKELATDLFNRWGVGKADKDNGLLLLVVMDQRRLEIETGYGVEGVFTDAVASRILHELVVPEMRAERPALGIQAAVDRVIQILNQPEALEEVIARSAPKGFSWLKVPAESWIAITLGGLAIAVFLIHSLRSLVASKDPFLAYKALRGGWLALAILGCLLVAGAFLFVPGASPLPSVLGSPVGVTGFVLFRRGVRRSLRARKRKCPECGKPMQLLNEVEDDAYLGKYEILEESIQSIDYDVWVCRSCERHRVDTFDGRNYGDFAKCQGCGARADKQISDVVLEAATRSSSGEGLRSYQCLACQRKRESRYTIPRISDSSSSSSGGSSGGSFGGGSSGGGGAGASW